MPRPNRRKQTAEVERGAIAAAIMDHPREFVGIVMALAATVTIVVNAMFLQRGPHPAPIFATAPATPAVQVKPVTMQRPAVTALPQAPPVQGAPEVTAPNRGQIVADIQSELARRGFYDGAVDGIWGVRTDGAVREFVLAAGLKISAEATEGLLRAIASSAVSRSAPPPQTRTDPIAQLLAPSKRVLAIQSALSDFGYGQIKPTGIFDAETRSAVEKFERDRRMPVTGQLSEPVVRALAAMTGRPLE